MGNNVRSVFLCREEEVAWEAYVDSPWRSARARELDQLGGAWVPVESMCAWPEAHAGRFCKKHLL